MGTRRGWDLGKTRVRRGKEEAKKRVIQRAWETADQIISLTNRDTVRYTLSNNICQPKVLLQIQNNVILLIMYNVSICYVENQWKQLLQFDKSESISYSIRRPLVGEGRRLIGTYTSHPWKNEPMFIASRTYVRWHMNLCSSAHEPMSILPPGFRTAPLSLIAGADPQSPSPFPSSSQALPKPSPSSSQGDAIAQP